MANVRYKEKSNRHLNIKGAQGLTDNEKKYLKAFFDERDSIGRKLDFPPFYVLGNQFLIEISKNPPKIRTSDTSHLRNYPSTSIYVEYRIGERGGTG